MCDLDLVDRGRPNHQATHSHQEVHLLMSWRRGRQRYSYVEGRHGEKASIVAWKDQSVSETVEEQV